MCCLSSILVTMMFNIKPVLNMISLCLIHSIDSEVTNWICVKEFPPQGSCQENTSSKTITTKGQGFHKNKARMICWPLWSLHLYHRVSLSWIAEQSWDGRWKDLGFFRAGRWLVPPATGSGRLSFLIISTRHNNGPVLKVWQGHNRGVLPKDSEKGCCLKTVRRGAVLGHRDLHSETSQQATEVSVICVALKYVCVQPQEPKGDRSERRLNG